MKYIEKLEKVAIAIYPECMREVNSLPSEDSSKKPEVLASKMAVVYAAELIHQIDIYGQVFLDIQKHRPNK